MEAHPLFIIIRGVVQSEMAPGDFLSATAAMGFKERINICRSGGDVSGFAFNRSADGDCEEVDFIA